MVDPRLSGYLTRALNHEMAAVQQYLTQATLLSMWGMQEAARQMRHESEEELEHAERIIAVMLAHGMTPRATQLPAARVGRSLADMLLIDRELEVEAIRLYDEAARYCQRVRNMQALQLFTTLLREEQEHLASVEKWLLEVQRQETGQGGAHGG